MSEDRKPSVSRRGFLELGGIAGVAASGGGFFLAGVDAGESSESYTGWESFHPGTQFSESSW